MVQKTRTRYDHIEHVEKFNPYHDERGRFAEAGNASFMTIRTKDPSKQHMADIAVERARQGAGGSTATKPKNETPEQKAERLQGKTREESIRNAENEIKNQSFESIAIIDSDGKVVAFKDGEEHCVNFSDITAKQNIEHMTLTHNHPGGDPVFSVDDVKTAVIRNVAEIRTVTADGSGCSLINENGYFSYDRSVKFINGVITAHNKAAERAHKEMDSWVPQALETGKMTQDEASDMYTKKITSGVHKYLKRYATTYGWRYEYREGEYE